MAPPSTFKVHTSRLFDSENKTFISNVTLVINPTTALIESTYQRKSSESLNLESNDIDLRGKTVLPGLVDAHTHIFIHPHAETPSFNQERDESAVERVVRATNHCRAALKAGYTTYRDLGSEGLFSADVGMRDAINRGLTQGPRLFVVSEALASSAGYEIRHENHLLGDVTVPRLADTCDGVDGCTAAVRRRIGAGADLIKFYADYRRRVLRFPQQTWKGCCPILHPPPEHAITGLRNPNRLLFNQEEMNAMVIEAKRAGAPIAAHASTPEGVIMAARAGVTTIEHNYYPSHEALAVMKEMGTLFVPTLAVLEAYRNEIDEDDFNRALQHTKTAHDMGVRLACGGDTGPFAHGDNAREMELFVQVGVPVVDTLRASTLGGWEACGGESSGFKFGYLGEGWRADIVALDGDLEKEKFAEVIRKVSFVMKDGKAEVVDGKLVV